MDFPQKILDGVPVIELSKYNQTMTRQAQKYETKYHELKTKYIRTRNLKNLLECMYEDLKTNYPEIYWEITNRFKSDWRNVTGRIVDTPTFAIEQARERDYHGKCVKCGIVSYMLNGENEIIATRLSIDHIHEKVDGGSNDKGNIQILCIECHSKKTKLFAYVRYTYKSANKDFTKDKASEFNKLWLEDKASEVFKQVDGNNAQP